MQHSPLAMTLSTAVREMATRDGIDRDGLNMRIPVMGTVRAMITPLNTTITRAQAEVMNATDGEDVTEIEIET